MSDKLNKILNNQLNSTYIIAEIGINHNGSLDTALELIHKAYEAGVNAVKFQKRDLSQIYSDRILKDSNSAEWNFEYLIPLLKELELSKEDYKVIEKTCKKLNLDLIITPMDEISAEFVSTLDIVAFKIASADMTNLSLIKKCSTYNKPLLISTGMWGESDIKKCVDFYKKNNIKYSLLLANSTYPSPYEDIGLNFLHKLKTLSNVVGYSGHERGTFIPVAAVSLGAKIIEKHITLNRKQKGPDHKASMTPSQWKTMVKDIRSLELSLTDKKYVNQAETLNKEAFAKSAVSIKSLPKNHILTSKDIKFQSPGKGIFEHEIEDFLGKELKRLIPEGKYISKEDFRESIPVAEWKEFNFSKKWGVKCRFHDYETYKKLKSPVIEFHCSQSDLDIEFLESNSDSELIIHAPEIVDRELVNICSTNGRIVQKSLDIIQRSIDKTIQIAKGWPKAKPKMVVHLGGMSLDLLEKTSYGLDKLSTHDEMITIAIHNFKRLKYDKNLIDIIPENLPPRPWYLGGEWFQYGFAPYTDMIRFCQETGVKMTYDICHAMLQCNLENISLTEYTHKVMPYVSHMHISDATGLNGEGIQMFEGEIDFNSVFNATKGYEFSWVTEIWSGHLYNGSGTYKALRDIEKNFNNIL
jgi:N-acetylneuraminate synthase|tara:strand:+ start:14428 stop:16341 length:1914 start_codon:yes stop_codon:yes gene_type:complete